MTELIIMYVIGFIISFVYRYIVEDCDYCDNKYLVALSLVWPIIATYYLAGTPVYCLVWFAEKVKKLLGKRVCITK